MSGDSSTRRARRAAVARAAARQAGLLTGAQLRALGVGAETQRAELAAQRWSLQRPGIVRVSAPSEGAQPAWWEALLTCSPRTGDARRRTAALGGLTSLLAAGMTTITGDGFVHVAAPKSSRPRPAPPGVRIHETRRWRDEDVVTDPVPRVRTPVAVIQAALWARTDREAALMLVAPVQQRLTTTLSVAEALETVRRDRRLRLMRAIVGELADGVRSLNELDFARMCRARGLPEPSRQVVVRRADGRAYLDVRWDRWRVTVEIDGVGHLQVDRWIEDSVRHNEIALTGDVVLRIPSLGLRLDPDRHLDLVGRALRRSGWRP